MLLFGSKFRTQTLMLNKSYTAVYTPCKVNIVDRLKDVCYISSEYALHGPTKNVPRPD